MAQCNSIVFSLNIQVLTEAKPCFASTCEESCEVEVLKRKRNKQYHTEDQGLRSRSIFLRLDQFKTNRERSKSAPLSRFKVSFKNAKGQLKFHQFYDTKKILEGIRIRLESHFSPTGNSKKPILLNRKPFKKQEKIEKNLMKVSVSAKTHSAENLKEFFMLVKRFVCSKNRGWGFEDG